MKTDIDIAREAEITAIGSIASKLGIGEEYLSNTVSLRLRLIFQLFLKTSRSREWQINFSYAISPTPAGEGKTTTSVGLVDGLCHIGKKAMICLREPSLGPCFGMKGGAAGGGFVK